MNNTSGITLLGLRRTPQETAHAQESLDIKYATDIENIEHVDDLRVEEWNQLSIEARELALEDVHCVVDKLIEEEPEFVKRRLAQMEAIISKNRKKFAYDRALFLSPSYVRDRDFALMFLRSVNFDPRKAAECMIAHFELKLDLFGLECLARAITLADLNEEDMVTLEAGNCQYLSKKDRGGRAVFCVLYKVQQNSSRVSPYNMHSMNLPAISLSGLTLPPSYAPAHNQQRVNFYQTMVALEDVETQKRGIVLVLFQCHADGHNVGRERLNKSLKFLQGLPWKFMGVHYCCSEESMPVFLPFQNMIQYLIGSDGRTRFRAHLGKNILCMTCEFG
jgi:hypothetical protein